MKSGETIEVTAVGIETDGRGISAEGVSVADLLPGERALATVEHVSRHSERSFARIEQRLGPLSPARVRPSCPAFGRCGGCRWQHLEAGAQLEAKRARLEAAFAAAEIALEIRAPAAAPAALGYRNKGKYVIGRAIDGGVVLGAYEPRSHDIVSTLGCAVVEPIIDRLALSARDAIERLGIEPYDEKRETGLLRYLIIRSGADGRVVATVVSRSRIDQRDIERLAAALIESGHASGVRWARNDRSDGGLMETAAVRVAGDGFVGEWLGGFLTDVDPAAFWQVNRKQASRIYARIGACIGGIGGIGGGSAGVRVLDAYAGVGAIGLAAAQAGAEVTTVEIDAAAAQVSRDAADRAGLTLRAVEGDAAIALSQTFDAVVVNPPRRGLSAEMRAALATQRPAMILYLSCGPESLARDVAALCQVGYAPAAAEPFDMMPGTGEIETLVTLSLVS